MVVYHVNTLRTLMLALMSVMLGCESKEAAFIDRVIEYNPVEQQAFDLSSATMLARDADEQGVDVYELFIAHRATPIADDLLFINLCGNSQRLFELAGLGIDRLSDRERLVIHAWFNATADDPPSQFRKRISELTSSPDGSR